MRIVEITQNSGEKAALIAYARSCSWQGTGAYFAELLANDEFEETEYVIAAVDGDEIVGFAALVNESCVEYERLSPWLDFLFVDERYRGKGLARRMVEHIISAAMEKGARSVYLCTVSHEKMYNRLGFEAMYRAKTDGNDECTIMKVQLK